MHEVFLLTGSNLGDRKSHLNFALEEILAAGDIEGLSGVYESVPWGYESKKPYLNQCVKLGTDFSPQYLLKLLKAIEKMAGRVQIGQFYEDRCLDIDILFYDLEIIQTENLVIPHPRLHLRAFTLVPLAEIAPDFEHPILRKKVMELLKNLGDIELPVRYLDH